MRPQGTAALQVRNDYRSFDQELEGDRVPLSRHPPETSSRPAGFSTFPVLTFAAVERYHSSSIVLEFLGQRRI
jgi:hypothetical protein